MLTSSNPQGPAEVFPGYIMVPTGGRVTYVHSSGAAALDTLPPGMYQPTPGSFETSVKDAMAKCRANRGDRIICLPGHTESVTTTTTPTFIAGVGIEGIGVGTDRPTFNWTATGSTWAMSAANVYVNNCVLNLAATAATAVSKAIAITGASNAFRNNRIILGGAGGTQLATIGIEVGTGADRTLFYGNRVESLTDTANVACFKVVAAVDSCVWVENVVDVGMSATTAGVITMTTAPTNVLLRRNVFRNGIASSTKCLVGITAATGYVELNTGYITAATGGATAFGTLGSLQLTENYGCAGGAVTGILIGTGSS